MNYNIDNGQEFTEKNISGNRENKKMSDEKILIAILKRFGISATFTKFQSTQEKIIERAHLIFKNQFCREKLLKIIM